MRSAMLTACAAPKGGIIGREFKSAGLMGINGDTNYV